MYLLLLIFVLLTVAQVSSIPSSNTGVRDCSDKDEIFEHVGCLLRQEQDHVQNILKHIESKHYGDRLRKWNQDLHEWADKQEIELEKLMRRMDRNLNKIQNKGPMAALIGDMTRIIGMVVGIPFRAANILLRDVFGLNKFWSNVMIGFWSSYYFYSSLGGIQTK